MPEASAPKQIHDLPTPRRRRGLVAALVSGALIAGAMSGIALAAGSGQFQFDPLAASAACNPGGNTAQPFVIPEGYQQVVFASEGDGGTIDQWDMNTQNETGVQAGRYLYRTHETGSNGMVSVTDLETGTTKILAQRADWERLDGIAWTPWGTLLAAEETDTQLLRDPDAPQAVPGLIYELFLDPHDPTKLDTTVTGGETPGVLVRPAIGARSHEGLRFDSLGNLYGISETSRVDNSPFQEGPGGFIYKFTPDRRGDLSSGQLYALKLEDPSGDRLGDAVWVPLDRETVQIDSDLAAFPAGATGYDRPEDVELSSSTGSSGDGANTMYVAITGEDRVLAIGLRQPAGGSEHLTATVVDYVRAGVNAPPGGTGPDNFDAPDNLALDHAGNLYITEDPGGSSPNKTIGDDIWVAVPAAGALAPAAETVRFATITDCNAEPTGVYFDMSGTVLYVNFMHPGIGRVSQPDMGVAIAPDRFAGHLPPAVAP